MLSFRTSLCGEKNIKNPTPDYHEKSILSVAVYSFFALSLAAQIPTSLLTTNAATASTNTIAKGKATSEKDKPLFAQSRSAQFEGGFEAMADYLNANMEYPEIAIEYNIEGIVYVQFLVAADGSLSDLKVVKSVHEILDLTALKIIKKMPNWKPAMQAGNVVKMRVIVPVEFSLQ